MLGLRRGPGQDKYLDSRTEIFAAADDESRAMPHPWAVHDAATGALVGFAMISDNIPEPIDEDLVGSYFLWKLLIGESLQGGGYGRATLDAVVQYLESRPGADVLYTSCSDGTGSTRGFYLRYGFTDTGRVMWGENVLALDLEPSTARRPPDGRRKHPQCCRPGSRACLYPFTTSAALAVSGRPTRPPRARGRPAVHALPAAARERRC